MERQKGYHLEVIDKDYACMECCSNVVDLYEHEQGTAEMWTFCAPCEVWTCHPCTCCKDLTSNPKGQP